MTHEESVETWASEHLPKVLEWIENIAGALKIEIKAKIDGQSITVEDSGCALEADIEQLLKRWILTPDRMGVNEVGSFTDDCRAADALIFKIIEERMTQWEESQVFYID